MVRTKEITKEWLINQRITIAGTDIYRINGTTGMLEKLNWQEIPGHSKYGTPKVYYGIAIWDAEKKEQRIIPVHRIIYAWYRGIAHAGLVINHINGKTNENNIENLEEVTQHENLLKRAGNGNNQWYYQGLLSDDKLEEARTTAFLAADLRKKNQEENKKLRLRLKEVDSKIKELKKQYWAELRKAKASILTNKSISSYQRPVVYDQKREEIKNLYKEDLTKYSLEAQSLRSSIHNNVVEYNKAITEAKNLRAKFLTETKNDNTVKAVADKHSDIMTLASKIKN